MSFLSSLGKLTLVLLTFLAACFYLFIIPTNISQLHFKGKIIKIGRNEYGIATIHASSIEQYLYALGTILAEDRLFQLALRAYSTQGRLSEFLGERPLEYDRFMREVNIKGWADKRAARLQAENPAEYEKLNLLVLGINDRVRKMPILPIQFYLTGMKWENFTVNHIFYQEIILQWSVSMNIQDQYLRSLLLNNHTKEEIDWILPNRKDRWAFESVPIITKQEIPERLRTDSIKQHLQSVKFNPLSVQRPIQLDIIEYHTTIDASNAWAVSGQHTESGLPILSNDPHLESIMPSHWYQFIVNYTTQNGTNWVTSAIQNPGNPRFFGKSPYFTTAVTICHGDNQDLYKEKVQGNQYFLDGEWKDLKIRKQIIKIKNGSGIRQEQYTVYETHRGPIIHYIFNSMGSFKIENESLSLAWTGFNTEWQSLTSTIENFLISNLSALEYHLKYKCKTFYQVNMLVITSDNHIITQQSGLYPIRRNVESGNYVKDGTTTEHDWVGIVPAEDRMHVIDPPKGFFVNANNRLGEEDYYGGLMNYTAYTARGDRITQLIKAEIQSGRKIGKEFMKKVLYDTVDVYCRSILPEILAVVEDSRPILSSFDCNFTSTSYAASFYEVFMFQLYQLMKPYHSERMSIITFHQMQQGIFNFIHFAYRGDTSKQTTMRTAWPKVLVRLEKHFETKDHTKWLWGNIHRDTNRHLPFRTHNLLSRIFDREAPGFGNFHTPNVGKMDKLEFGSFDTTHHANLRLLYGYGKDFVDEWIVDGGASENILSGHYSDQWDLMVKEQLIPIFMQQQEDDETNQDL